MNPRQGRNTIRLHLSSKNNSSANIINRREIEPLLLKAREIIKFYEQATDCGVAILDQPDNSIEIPDYERAAFFCKLCKQYCPGREPLRDQESFPCEQIHLDAVAKAQHIGGTYIYICDLGFTYWTSIFYSGGCYAGALIAGKFLAVERERIVEKITALSGGAVPAEEIRSRLEAIPEKSREGISSLAQLLQICAERISDSTEDYRDVIERITEQDSELLSQIRFIKTQRPKVPDAAGGPAGGQAEDQNYPLDKERILLAALRRGDYESGRKILNELLENILITAPDNFEFIRLRAIELVVLLSRAAITPDDSEDNQLLENNNRYLRRIQESQSIEELTENLHIIVERMAGAIFSFQGIRHASALRKAERFIWDNYTRKISLQEIADASGLSAPYFSTIFKEEMGENLSAYLNRLRAEKAAVMLTETDLPLSEIACICGFEDQSWFSKIFKNFAGVSPGKYRENGGGEGNFHPSEPEN
ncbi:MAG: helix-turn-helix domain-containing protein [Treponema sp.]|jgi:AraC-like DNA-binding protein/ligand-binding sensor protein|nr:helix-turn-helix domain-containing protein [Treponema sp.]